MPLHGQALPRSATVVSDFIFTKTLPDPIKAGFFVSTDLLRTDSAQNMSVNPVFKHRYCIIFYVSTPLHISAHIRPS